MTSSLLMYPKYNFQITNDSDSPINCEKTELRSDAFIGDCSKYKLQILKFTLPSEEIDSFKVSNTNDFRVKLGSVANNILYEASNSIFLNSEHDYKNESDFLDSLNRTFILTYKDYLQSYNTNFSNVKTVNSVFSFSKAIGSGVNFHEQTISIIPTSPNTSKVGYIYLQIKVGFTGFESNPVNNNSPHNHSLFLISPSAKSCLIYANSDTLFANNLTFEEGSNKSVDELLNITVPIPTGTYHPIESFLKFSDGTNESGNWKLRFVNNCITSTATHEFHLNVDATISVYYLPAKSDAILNVCQKAPYVQLNESNNKLELFVNEQHVLANNYIKLSPKLYSVLGFQGKLDPTDGYYRIKIPQIALSTAQNETITVEQPYSTKFKLLDIKQILIKSNSIPIVGEEDFNSKQPILMSLDFTSTTIKDVLEFQSTQQNRYYEMISNQALDTINFSVWVTYNYSNETYIVQLPPYSKFQMLISFVRKDLL